MSVTLKTVAQKCGLPLSQVATVLTQAARIDGDTRQKVLDAARDCGYPLDGLGKLTHNLGVLFVEENNSGLTHPFFAAMINSFKTEAEAHGYDITFINHNIGTEPATYLDHCRYRSVDGVFIARMDFNSREVMELLTSDIPCVTADHCVPGQPSVNSDNRAGIRMLVDYAVSLGHKRIAFIHGQCNSRVTDDRVTEFRAAMRDHGLYLPDHFLVEARYGDLDLVRRIVREMVQQPERPSCILLPDDTSYLGAQEAIRESELRIPADISVAGYDGIALTQSLRPHLTTIRQNSEEMGRVAALRLIEKIERPSAAVNDAVSIPVTLLKGETVGWCNNW